MRIAGIIQGLRNRHFLSLAGNGSMAALSIVTYALLYRLLPEVDMGNWVFFQFSFALLDAFRTGFLQTALIKFYSGTSDERKAAVAGSAWYIAIIITALFCLLNLPFFLLVNTVTDSGVLLLLQWAGLSLLLTLPFNVTFWILQADERFDRILILRWVNQGSFIIYLVILFFLNQITILSILYGYLGSSLLTSLVALFSGWCKLITIRKKTTATVKELFHFGKFSLGSYICSSLLRTSDSIIIKFMIGPAALAVYTLAQRIAEVVEILIRSFLGTAMPSMSAAYNRGDKAQIIYLMKKYAGMLTLLLIPVIATLALSADILVRFLGGEKYVNTEAANVLRIFMVFALIFPLDRFAGITLDIIHKPHLNFIKVVLTLVVNVVTDIIALKIFGNVYGAAAASIFTLLFAVSFGYFTLRRFLPFNINGVIRLGYSESKTLLIGFLRKKPAA